MSLERLKTLAPRLKNAKLRRAAGLLFIGSAKDISIEIVHEDERFKHLDRATLYRWAREDSWLIQRDEFIEKWTARAREQLGERLTQARLDEMELLDEIRDHALAKIRSDLVQPKSLEGMIKAALEVMKYQDQLRGSIGADVIADTANSARGLPTSAQIQHSEEELNLIAREVLRRRHAAVRAELAANSEVTNADKRTVDESSPVSANAESGDTSGTDSEGDE